MAAKYLKLLERLAKPNGHLFLSWFFGNPANPIEHRLEQGEDFRDHNNLVFALYSPHLFRQLIDEAGLYLYRIDYGYWRGYPDPRMKGQHYQDIAILRRRAVP
jgi:hypothetical protein